MTEFSDLSADDQARLQAAAQWRLRLPAEPSLELSEAFQAWIADRDNARVFAAVDESWAAIGELGASAELLALRRSALRRAHRAGAARWLPTATIARAASVLLIAGLLAAGGVYIAAHNPTRYATEVGQRREFALADGSRISLDSNSVVRVRFTKSARILELDRGRALFDVAHDVSRPFSVTAGGETVVAVGTAFDVERLGPKVLVTLVRGRVVIKSAKAPAGLVLGGMPHPTAAPVTLEAGQMMVVDQNRKPMVGAANLQVAAAWTQGHLVFDNEPLSDAVAQVNRYTNNPIRVDPQVANLRVSGEFNAGDVSAFVSGVTSYFPLQASTTADNGIELQRRAEK